MRFRVSCVRMTMNNRRWLRIMDGEENIALVPYSDSRRGAHEQCYADANMIVDALNKGVE